MPKPKITESDLCRAAKRLRTSTAEVETVGEVESRGEPFYPDGFPVILFERHKFYSFAPRTLVADPADEEGGKIPLRDLWYRQHPSICNPKSGGYGKAGQNQKNKFNLAFSLDPVAAMKSCSWGKFQIMGFNHGMCGYDTVGEFVDAMKESEGKQLDAFVSFVISAGLADELRNHQWARFARGYNGAGYKENDYDTKLEKAFEKYAKRKINCEQVSAKALTDTATDKGVMLTDQPPESSKEEPSPNDSGTKEFKAEITPGTNIENIENAKIEAPKPSPQAESVSVKRERVSIWAKIAAAFAAITSLGINLGTVFTTKLNELSPQQIVWLVVACLLIAAALWFYDRAAQRAHEKTIAKVDTASDPAKNTVELKG